MKDNNDLPNDDSMFAELGLPPMIGPIKKTKHLDIDFSMFDNEESNDKLRIGEFAGFYLDYDGFYELLILNNFKIGEYLEENQNVQIDLIIEYFIAKKEFDKAINLITHKYEWLLELLTNNEEYEECAVLIDSKNKFLNAIETINKKHNTEY